MLQVAGEILRQEDQRGTCHNHSAELNTSTLHQAKHSIQTTIKSRVRKTIDQLGCIEMPTSKCFHQISQGVVAPYT
ncbi:hypothetical protein M404DRAFT_556612 [Pisolithus tinctorius Marx 270]|uniref:Uncharacterized protein n=1 Tax=Pisolithus tinctorius Marx 270 TaxID=870435 RepID=A0A0C3J554_PISTI|nr:hypothetical protein M404DRAFT_556612 [Pisolithus tinctorius Marx 270]